MAPVQRPDSLPLACQHFKAEPVGTTEAHRLRDGRWQYQTSYQCPDCGAHFSEVHTGGSLSARIDEAFARVNRLREILGDAKPGA